MKVISLMAAIIFLLPISDDALAQSDTSARPISAGFEGAHIAVSSALIMNASRLNVDVSLTRWRGDVLGVRAMLAADNLSYTHSIPPTQYAAGLLALLGIRTERTQFDIAVGVPYFTSHRSYNPGWKFYASGDLRVPIISEYVSLLVHASTVTAGVGVSFGYMRQ
jgi:hypothetical protein